MNYPTQHVIHTSTTVKRLLLITFMVLQNQQFAFHSQIHLLSEFVKRVESSWKL